MKAQGSPLDKSKIKLIAKLLEKACSTEYEFEAVALLERSYRLLAEVISNSDISTEQLGDPPRERRQLGDRRRQRPRSPYASAGFASPTEGAERYRQVAETTAKSSAVSEQDPRMPTPRREAD